MKKLSLIIALLYVCLNLNAQQRSVGVGLRVGTFTQRNEFGDKTLPSDGNRNIRSGLYYQAFVNKELGAKRNWMIEANLGYNSYSYESMINYPTLQPEPLYRYTFAKSNVYSVQLNLRYAFASILKLNWKHYAGVSIACHDVVTNTHSFYNTHNPDPTIVEHDNHSSQYYQNYVGLEYFGKIRLNDRLSIQYLAGYNLSTDVLTLTGKNEYEGSTVNRFNINFGLSYQL